MVSEEAGCGRRGGHRRCVAARATRATGGILLGAVLLAATVGYAEDGRSDQAPASGRAVDRPIDDPMRQALRALARGLAERAEELGEEIGREAGGTLATGSITAPLTRSWIAPVPLPQVSPVRPPPSQQAGRDLARLFQPDPLGASQVLQRARPAMGEHAAVPDAARLPALPHAVPGPSGVVQRPPPASQAREAMLPEPRLDAPTPAAPFTPAPLPPAAAVHLSPRDAIVPQGQAALAEPDRAMPPASPSRSPQGDADQRDNRNERTRPEEAEGKPAGRDEPVRRTAARPAERDAERPDDDPRTAPGRRGKAAARTAARPSDDAEQDAASDVKERAVEPTRRAKRERARAATRQKPSAAARTAGRGAPALVAEEVTGALARSSPRLQARAPAAAVMRNARRPDADIPIIALPDALRPTRPPAGSPL